VRLLQLDHLVLTVNDIQTSCDFYATILGMEVVTFGDNRKALRFGEQKINLHQAGQEFEPKAAAPTPGSADLCFLTDHSASRQLRPAGRGRPGAAHRRHGSHHFHLYSRSGP